MNTNTHHSSQILTHSHTKSHRNSQKLTKTQILTKVQKSMNPLKIMKIMKIHENPQKPSKTPKPRKVRFPEKPKFDRTLFLHENAHTCTNLFHTNHEKTMKNEGPFENDKKVRFQKKIMCYTSGQNTPS